MVKIQFCSGSHRLGGWLNADIEFDGDEKVDITQPLPFADESADYVFCSHGVEHVTAPQAFRFFQECFRILKWGGIMRICVPSITRTLSFANQEYIDFVTKNGWGDGSIRGAVSHLITHHGHLACWHPADLSTAIWCAGFDTTREFEINKSDVQELCDIEKHGEVIGEKNNWIESIVIQGYKLSHEI